MRLLENVREDDIFLLLDADELPNKESLLFLKLFDGLVFKHILSIPTDLSKMDRTCQVWFSLDSLRLLLVEGRGGCAHIV